MKNYRIELGNNTELIDKLKERLEEIIFNESQDEFDIDIIIYTSSLNDKVIFKVYEEFIFSNVNYHISSINYRLIDNKPIDEKENKPYVMVLGNVVEGMTLMSPLNVRVIGEVSGNIIIQNDECYVYANHFNNANVIFNSSLKHISCQDNLKVFSK